MTCPRCLGVGQVYKRRPSGNREAVECPKCKGDWSYDGRWDSPLTPTTPPNHPDPFAEPAKPDRRPGLTLPPEHYTKVDKALPGEEPRLSKQARQILALFRKHGRLSNTTLTHVALRYSARIYDLRTAGYKVELVARDRDTGETWYELREEP